MQESDEAGNWSTSGEFATITDTTPPNAPVGSAQSPTESRRPRWTWLSGGRDGNGAYRYRVDGDTNAWADTTQTGYAPDADLALGLHTLYVQERDAAGNWSLSGISVVSIVSGVVISGRITSDGRGAVRGRA